MRLDSIQFLRFVAAMGVLLLHAHDHAVKYSAAGGGHAFAFARAYQTGDLGVQLFFVISGFVMVLSARESERSWRGARGFMRRRLIRIVPLYWAVTACMLLLLLLLPQSFQTLKPSAWHTAASFLFIPARNNVGEVTPLVTVGWTLNYEMFFYALVAASLLLPPRARHAALVAALLSGPLSGLFLPAEGIAARFIQSPYLLFFAIGYGAGNVYASGRFPRSGLAAAALLAAALGWAAASSGWTFQDAAWRRAVTLGPLFGALILLGAVHDARLKARLPAWGVRLGNSSYALYLTHLFVLAALGKLWQAAGADAFLGPNGFAAAGVLCSVAAAEAAYLYGESKATRWLQRRYGRAESR